MANDQMMQGLNDGACITLTSLLLNCGQLLPAIFGPCLYCLPSRTKLSVNS